MVWPERVCISVHEGDWRSAVLCLIEIKPRENCIIRKFYLIKSGIYRKSVHSGKRNHNWNRYQEYFFGALIHNNILCCCSVVQSLSHVWVFVTPWTAACQSSLSFTISQSLLDSCPLSRWCHPTISSSFFSPYLQSFPESGSFPTSQLFTSSGQSIGASASASVLPMNIQCSFPLGLTGLISLKSKRLSTVFSNTMVRKHQFSDTHPSLCTHPIHYNRNNFVIYFNYLHLKPLSLTVCFQCRDVQASLSQCLRNISVPEWELLGAKGFSLELENTSFLIFISRQSQFMMVWLAMLTLQWCQTNTHWHCALSCEFRSFLGLMIHNMTLLWCWLAPRQPHNHKGKQWIYLQAFCTHTAIPFHFQYSIR